jgi:hypothetical protein
MKAALPKANTHTGTKKIQSKGLREKALQTTHARQTHNTKEKSKQTIKEKQAKIKRQSELFTLPHAHTKKSQVQ